MKIKGRFCETRKAPKGRFDPRSFRWKKSGRGRILIGCPKGKWNAKTERCRVGTQAYAVLAPVKRGSRCPPGARAAFIIK